LYRYLDTRAHTTQSAIAVESARGREGGRGNALEVDVADTALRLAVQTATLSLLLLFATQLSFLGRQIVLRSAVGVGLHERRPRFRNVALLLLMPVLPPHAWGRRDAP
jgi:hypothetical protein